MNGRYSLSLAWIFLLAAGLSGCGAPIKKSEYPSSWPSRLTSSAQSDCPDISGRFMVGKSEPPLPFFLFGVPDTTSLDWAHLVQIVEQLNTEPDRATVTIESPDSDHIQVVVAMRGSPVGKQVLTRSYRSATTARVWFGQSDKTFLCDPNGVVMNGAYIFSWALYGLPDEEKKRRFRRPGKNDVGTSRGYFYFSKAADGSLVMLQQLYSCYACDGLDEVWRRWVPAQD